MPLPRLVTILGATGSIGTNALDVIAAHPDKFKVDTLVAGSNVDKLAELSLKYNARRAIIADEGQYGALKSALSGTDIEVECGQSSVDGAALNKPDIVIAAIVGVAGLQAVMKALALGVTVAFASKECLVAAGEIMMKTAEDNNALLLPLDSEHNAIFQVLDPNQKHTISRLVLTASGGPFLHTPIQDFSGITVEQAVDHPNWDMGAKISVDSATMMNKALEVIEAKYLFKVPHRKIDVVIHPQSKIHSLVEYVDGSYLCQIGPSDMRTAITYCLGYPERIATSGERLDFVNSGPYEFLEPDTAKFRSLSLVRNVMDAGQAHEIVFNAANEIAVNAFLSRKIKFSTIYEIIEESLESMDEHVHITTLEDVIEQDQNARRHAEELIKNTKAEK